MLVAVCGPNEATDEEVALAERLGELLARAGATVICGGRGGVMAAVCRGAKQAGGTTIGILPGTDPREANRWVDYPLCTGIGEARNAVVVASGQVVIAVGGGLGTLSEIALALKLGRPVIALRTWPLDPELLARTGARLVTVTSAEEAAQRALEHGRTGQSG
ncbi:TIGR00725 family protein [Thermomicrobium sp. 4228-Ro]|uniref:TIGR00725 family protein n=1 Tax=Thermomicrobium sp. 4228-Ro TaxID=2993937 RepID=UPI002248E7BA|nr:TIGR00725 family protein [Thermomicrobium sp. 4228-Ro]MCX2727310.1 TIGR00725 family protein [Thermomicrobium sp. 4228-Ro]